jgi:hypothetical protein
VGRGVHGHHVVAGPEDSDVASNCNLLTGPHNLLNTVHLKLEGSGETGVCCGRLLQHNLVVLMEDGDVHHTVLLLGQDSVGVSLGAVRGHKVVAVVQLVGVGLLVKSANSALGQETLAVDGGAEDRLVELFNDRPGRGCFTGNLAKELSTIQTMSDQFRPFRPD